MDDDQQRAKNEETQVSTCYLSLLEELARAAQRLLTAYYQARQIRDDNILEIDTIETRTARNELERILDALQQTQPSM